jgi:hypothetical protein
MTSDVRLGFLGPVDIREHGCIITQLGSRCQVISAFPDASFEATLPDEWNRGTVMSVAGAATNGFQTIGFYGQKADLSRWGASRGRDERAMKGRSSFQAITWSMRRRRASSIRRAQALRPLMSDARAWSTYSLATQPRAAAYSLIGASCEGSPNLDLHFLTISLINWLDGALFRRPGPTRNLRGVGIMSKVLRLSLALAVAGGVLAATAVAAFADFVSPSG